MSPPSIAVLRLVSRNGLPGAAVYRQREKLMNALVRRRLLPALVLPLLLASAGCDIVTAEFRSEERSEWRKTYPLDPSGHVEISNINGKINVQPGDGNAVEVVAIK